MAVRCSALLSQSFQLHLGVCAGLFLMSSSCCFSSCMALRISRSRAAVSGADNVSTGGCFAPSLIAFVAACSYPLTSSCIARTLLFIASYVERRSIRSITYSRCLLSFILGFGHAIHFGLTTKLTDRQQLTYERETQRQ